MNCQECQDLLVEYAEELLEASQKQAVDDHERAIVEHALGKHRWNQRQTAKALGLTYDQLRHTIKKHGLVQ